MSIIYEALKKLQKSEPKRHYPKKISFFVYIIMAILGILLASLIFLFFTKPKRIIPPPSPISLVSPKNTLEIKKEEIKPIEEKELIQKIPSFSLSGILYSDTEKWVMINNRILKEGDTIQGAKVIRISEDGAELDLEGEKIFLRLR